MNVKFRSLMFKKSGILPTQVNPEFITDHSRNLSININDQKSLKGNLVVPTNEAADIHSFLLPYRCYFYKQQKETTGFSFGIL